MKTKLLSLFALTIAAGTAIAQPNLTASTMNPVIGDVFYGHMLDTNVSKGPSGAGVTWNFASVTQMSLDTTTYKACDSTPYCSSFPGSNIAQLNGGDYVYGTANSSALQLNGVHSMGMNIVFSNPQVVMHYPFTYNSVFVDTSSAVIASVYYHTEIDSFIGDAWGTLTLPSGTFNNVLRIRQIVHSTDSFGTDVSHARTESYNWFVPTFHNPIMTIGYDTAGSTTSYVSSAAYYTAPHNVGVRDMSKAVSGVKVYPNPATDMMHIEFTTGDASATTVTITDLMGKVGATLGRDKINTGKNDIAYSVADFSTGVYILQIQNAGGVTSEKFVVSK